MIGELKTKTRLHPAVWVLGIVLAVTSCSSPSPTVVGKGETFQQETGSVGYGGQTLTDMVTTTNTVVSIDEVQRQIVMRTPKGNEVTYRAGREISNFADFKVGDPVKATVIEQLGIAVVGSGNLPPAGPVMVRARNGTVLTSMPVTVVQFKAIIVGLNPDQGQVMLQTADGQKRVVNVQPGVNLHALNVGDDVSVQATEAMAIKLEKP